MYTVAEIKELIRINKLYRFYKNKAWEELKRKIMMDFHNECVMCKRKAKITQSQTVHHVNHVKTHPELAYEEYYVDSRGIRRRNLIPLCNKCHNEVHERFGHVEKKPITEEKW